MSTAAKSFFLGSCIFSTAVIYKVHGYQEEERKRMREGVYKDIERRNTKKSNVEINEQQKLNKQMYDQQVKLQESLSNQSSK